jgi:dTDP-4-amino-4,6-dideoxygalactose transaminase
MDDAPPAVPMIDLGRQRRRLGARLDAAIAAVVDHGQFILGPEVARLEGELAARTGSRHVIGCSSGTDALLLALMAWTVGPGDAVFVPSFTFAATAEVVVRVGATPFFVDVRPDTFDLDVGGVGEAVDAAHKAGLRPAGVIAVDPFGQPADYDALRKVSADEGLWVLADAAQSFGATRGGHPVGSLADVTATSFFPAKPLGCYGDGGAVFTDDDAMAARMRSLREHGRGRGKDDSIHVGINGRLDTLQAAILLTKLEIFDDELARRQQVADRYAAGLAGVATVPPLAPDTTSTWACYTVRVQGRERVRECLQEAGVASAVHYSKPLHRRDAYCGYPIAPGGLAVSAHLAQEVISLPMHPYLGEEDQGRVIAALHAATAADPHLPRVESQDPCGE